MRGDRGKDKHSIKPTSSLKTVMNILNLEFVLFFFRSEQAYLSKDLPLPKSINKKNLYINLCMMMKGKLSRKRIEGHN